MTRLRSGLILMLAILLTTSFSFVAVPTALAFEDDMSFDVDEVEPIDEDDMTFAPDEVPPATVDGRETLSMSVVAIPSGDLDSQDRLALQRELRSAVENVPGFMVYGDDVVLPGLEDRGTDTCVREPLCLSSVGRNGGVERILLARVARGSDGYRLNVDFFDVNERLFLRYHVANGLGSFDDVINAVRPAVNDIFNIRTPRTGDEFVDDNAVNIQRIMAYSTAGLAVASLAVGVYFGMTVGDLEDEFNAQPKVDGHYTSLTQVKAAELIRDMETTAVTANVFYGLSAALAVGSVLLFVLEGDSADEEASNERQPAWGQLRFSPTISHETVGIGAHLRF